MLTYKTTIEKPRLVIEHDDAESPREWSNLGYFVTIDRNYRSPDKVANIEMIVSDTAEQASNTSEHMELITKEINEGLHQKVLAIYPITRYDHSRIVYSLGENRTGIILCCGFYIITDKTAEVLGTKPEDFEKVIKQELDTYNRWANGEVYRFTLLDSAGTHVDGCGGFYDIEDMRDYLPEEFKNERLEDYRIN